ncbi:TlpA family protein disulfide reductase [Viscerimonas tarda]
MKKIILALILGISATFTVSAKDKVIVNPEVDFTNNGVIHFTKIELGKNETRMYMHCTYVPRMWVRFPSTSYIEDNATGEKWQATGILNGEFDKEIYMPASGDSSFVLIFPKLDKKVTKINFKEIEKAGGWEIYGISLDPKAIQKPKAAVPAEVQTWLDGEVAKSKRKSLMDFKADEFFSKDTARLVGYFKGYDPRIGFSAGIVYANNVATREDFPVVIKIHEDGRFEGDIPMRFPENLMLIFNGLRVKFYMQPGETLSILLDWEKFLIAGRTRNSRYMYPTLFRGASAQINKELSAFGEQLPELPYQKIHDNTGKKEPDEYKTYLASVTAGYTKQFKHLLETEKLSEQTKKILQDNYQIEYAYFLMDYASGYTREPNKNLPVEFYSFLQDMPMNDKELLSTSYFSNFINRFEYAAPFNNIMSTSQSKQPEKNFTQYLFEELGIKKTPEDIRYIEQVDSIKSYFEQANITKTITQEKIKELAEVSKKGWTELVKRHGEDKFDAYREKYAAGLLSQTVGELMTETQRLKDSVYANVLKLKPGIVYDITKVRALDNQLKHSFKDQKREDAGIFLKGLEAGIAEPFLIEESERLFRKNFPLEKRTAYELPNTAETKLFKEIIAPYKGKILLVDFWATSCAPCIGAIERHKEFRQKNKGSKDVDFVFITDETSPIDRYNKFVEEQELTNTYRVNMDEYKYLRQLFKFNGIPKYIIVDREGKILDEDANSYLFERDLKEILEGEKAP